MKSTQFRLIERALDLCSNKDTPEEVALNKLKAILEKNRKLLRARTEFGLPLIHLAVMYRSTAFCKELLKYDDNNQALKAVRRYYGLPFHLACDKGDVETAKYLLQQYPESVKISTPDGKYVMHILARRHEDGLLGRCQLIDFLGEHYPHEMSRICTTKGNTPLHDARRSNNFEIVRRVFNAYPDAIYIWNNDCDTPLGVAAAYQLDYVLTFFYNQLRLVREGQDDSARDSNGRLLIHRVIWDKSAEVGTIKLMTRANPNITMVADNDGQLPIHVACRVGHLGIVKCLVDAYGASLKMKDSEENLPLRTACLQGMCDIVQYILGEPECGVSAPNKEGKLPIELLLFEAKCDRSKIEYVQAVDGLLRATPGALACLLKPR